MIEENFDLGLTFLLTKVIIGAEGIEPSAPRALEQMDQLVTRMSALYTMRNATAAYKKFRAGTMLCQRPRADGGTMLADLGMTPFDVVVVDAPAHPIPK